MWFKSRRSTMMWKFKADHNFDHRQAQSSLILRKYPNRLPVIVEKAKGATVPDVDKKQYLIAADLSVAQFMWIIRKRINVSPNKAIFLFVDKAFLSGCTTMGAVYAEHKDEDGFLYIAYNGENTFGQ